MDEFRLAIIGSRDFNDYVVLSTLVTDCHMNVGITHVISGGAKGADSLGAQWAKDHGVQLVEYLPDWDKYGKSAGFRRNSDIIDDSDAVMAFWDMESRGTLDSINKANERGLDVFIYNMKTQEISLFEGNHG